MDCSSGIWYVVSDMGLPSALISTYWQSVVYVELNHGKLASKQRCCFFQNFFLKAVYC